MSFIKYYYNHVLKQELLTKYFYRNIYQLPRLKKIVLTFSTSQTSLKSLLPLIAALTLISSQTPSIITSKRVHVALKLKSGVPVGCKVDIRGKQKFLFLEKLLFSVLPRLKEFSIVYRRNTISISIFNLFVFKEIEKDYEYFPNLPKLSIYLVFSVSSNPKEIFDLLSSLNFPRFKKFIKQ